jgi:hypothetical protein
MGHQTTGIAMLLKRRLYAGTRTVAIGAKTRLVTDGTDPLAAYRGQAVIVSEQRRMLESPERKLMGLAIMALRTSAQIALFFGMFQGQVRPPLGPAASNRHSASQQDDA